MFFTHYTSSYPYSADGKPPWSGDTGIFDPLFVCALAAESTRTLTVGTAVLILRFDEYLQAIRSAWTMNHASFHGEFVSFDDVVLLPKPITPGGPPVLSGGESRAAMRRAARFGDGWYGWWAAGELEGHLAALRNEIAAAGRHEGNDFHLQLGVPYQAHDTPDRVLDKVAEARRCGVAEVVLGVPISARRLDADVDWWAGALAL